MTTKLLLLERGTLILGTLLYKIGKQMEILKWFTFLALLILLMISPNPLDGSYMNDIADEPWVIINSHELFSKLSND